MFLQPLLLQHCFSLKPGDAGPLYGRCDCGGTIFKVLVGGDCVSTGTGSYCCHGACIVSHRTWTWWISSRGPLVCFKIIEKITYQGPLQLAVAHACKEWQTQTIWCISCKIPFCDVLQQRTVPPTPPALCLFHPLKPPGVCPLTNIRKKHLHGSFSSKLTLGGLCGRLQTKG